MLLPLWCATHAPVFVSVVFRTVIIHYKTSDMNGVRTNLPGISSLTVHHYGAHLISSFDSTDFIARTTVRWSDHAVHCQWYPTLPLAISEAPDMTVLHSFFGRFVPLLWCAVINLADFLTGILRRRWPQRWFYIPRFFHSSYIVLILLHVAAGQATLGRSLMVILGITFSSHCEAAEASTPVRI